MVPERLSGQPAPVAPGCPRVAVALVGAFTAALLATPAWCAAPVSTDPAESLRVATALAQGVLHVLGGLDHVLAMLALGMWSALTARRVWLAPVVFAVAMAAGAAWGDWLTQTGVQALAIEPLVAASLLVLGLLLAGRTPLPGAAGSVLAAGFALFHGATHAPALSAASGVWTLAGMLIATAALQALGIALARWLCTRHAWIHRVVGAGVAAAGCVLLAQLT